MEQRAQKKWNWWTAGDALMLLSYSAVVLWTLQYHEKWADEAQAWLIARDLDLRTIWFHELRYEGSPGLWHTILWVGQHVFHAPYVALGYIAVAFAIAGAAVLLFLAPFPRIVRWPLAFTYVMIYQYAVIARPYVLFPLLAFCAAFFFNDLKHPERITIVLALLALLTLHGTILAACLALAYLAEAARERNQFDGVFKIRYAICAAVMVIMFVFVMAILKPTPDVEEFARKAGLLQPPVVTNELPSFWQKLSVVICGAFIDWLMPSILLVVLLGAWCIWRRRWLAFVLPVAGLALFYSFVHGAAHHHGTVFIAAITGMWIAWPSAQEQLTFEPTRRVAVLAASALLLILCFFNVWDGVVVIKHEYLYPYSGAKDAADYLTSVQAERWPLFGFQHGVVAIQAYFDHNIFANNPHSYFHHGLPLSTTMLDVDELNRVRPEYVVAYSDAPQVMLDNGAKELNVLGYELVHFSDGYYLYKQGVFEREVYFIFRRSANDLQLLFLSDGAGHAAANNAATQ
jgi:hypothetical protein